jgi:Mn-dependent DtxR family transcriptional regulator
MATARSDTSEISNAVQDYAKAIWSIGQRTDAPVSTSAIAERLDVSPASASAMVKRLESLGLVSREPYHGVQLTRAGERVALAVLRHHRLLELYLAEALGMPWDRVHEEAEKLEHAISPELSELIAAKLGNPTHDPHGDPIPTLEVCSRGSRTRTPRCCATSPGAGSGRETRSSWPAGSRLAARSRCGRTGASTRSATSWHGRCEWGRRPDGRRVRFLSRWRSPTTSRE